MFCSKLLSKFPEIKHCFFSRKNGASKGIYESLNCGIGSQDEKSNILKNLDIVSKEMQCEKKFLISLNQKHSDHIIHFNNKSIIANRLDGDGIVTNVKKIGISILTADCVPILFYNPKIKTIGCAHAGWKGALKGIVKNIVNKFNYLDSKNDDLNVAIGPCIGQESYEVGVEFYQKFINKNKKNSDCFNKTDNKKYLFNLRRFINKELKSLNIKKIDNIENDTFVEKENFFSFRRSLKNKEKDYGRCISVILMT